MITPSSFSPVRTADLPVGVSRATRSRGAKHGCGQAGVSAGLRFVEIAGDSMEPLLYRGDFVLATEARRWLGEGYYLIGSRFGEALYQCSVSGTRVAPTIRMHSMNDHYSDWHMTRAEFERDVTGKAVMTCNVKDRDLINHHRECFAA